MKLATLTNISRKGTTMFNEKSLESADELLDHIQHTCIVLYAVRESMKKLGLEKSIELVDSILDKFEFKNNEESAGHGVRYLENLEHILENFQTWKKERDINGQD